MSRNENLSSHSRIKYYKSTTTSTVHISPTTFKLQGGHSSWRIVKSKTIAVERLGLLRGRGHSTCAAIFLSSSTKSPMLDIGNLQKIRSRPSTGNAQLYEMQWRLPLHLFVRILHSTLALLGYHRGSAF